MSHPEQLGFFRLVAEENVKLIAEARVLEIGAYDVNGTVRKVFVDAVEYVGIDLTAGPGVDRVGFGHEVQDVDGSFDVTISGECFEHDPHWRETIQNMCRLTRPGGLVAFTCASRGRPEHGTLRTNVLESPGTQTQGLDYYKNLGAADFLSIPGFRDWFAEFQFWYLPTSFDLYFVGIRENEGSRNTGPRRATMPNARNVEALARLMPLSHRIARSPLSLLSRLLDGDVYQNIVVPYWKVLLRLQGRIAGDAFLRT